MALASYKILFLFILITFLTFPTTQAYDVSTSVYIYQNCSSNGTIAGSTFQLNLGTLFSSLSYKASHKMGFYKTPISDSVFGLFMCRGDIPPELCEVCVKTATQKLIADCSLSEQAVIWYDECMLRYSNRSFFSTVDLRPRVGLLSTANISNEESFMPLLFSTMNKTADEAANPSHPISDKKFATKEANLFGFQTLYCLAQCTPDLSPNDCRTCLDEAIGNLAFWCKGKQGGRVLYPSCNVRYALYPFYRSTVPLSSPMPAPVPVPASNFSEADSQFSEVPTYLSHSCSPNVPVNIAYKNDLKTLLSYMSSNATNGQKSYYKDSVDDTVYGLFMCRGDLPSPLCQQCVLNATHQIFSVCNSSQEGIIWYSHCMLRYSNRSFSSQVEKSPTYQILNDTKTFSQIPAQDFFTYSLSNTLANLAEAAGESNSRYASKSLQLNDLQTLYTFGQCTQDLSSDDCKGCLGDINGKIPWPNLGSVGGRVLYPSCNLRFELFQFYRLGDEAQRPRLGNPSPLSLKGKRKGQSRTIILIIVLTVISLILLSFGYYLIKRKTRKNIKTILREKFGPESVALEPLQFNLVVIEEATNNFSDDNRIGEGGFGEVYKGILPDGRQIAVKRLSKSSRQGEIEFRNEVLSIAKLQHRNLVGFIGFCLEKEDKVLIYEYVPNKSLDYFLFDSQQPRFLSWFERYTIIGGIARGILYLHEHSRLKIIHRDLKPSNVLLDENMIPKISDFGLARIVEINQDQGSTNKIVGTFGYMSPEYLLLGQFSEKSDVFSFGVMVLEIITGKKNSSSYELNRVAYGLLSYIWRQWKDQTMLSILDPSIKENYSEVEVIRCIQIGLLCVQPNPNARPSMVEIVLYLGSYLIDLPSPQEPAFGRMDPQAFAQELNSSQSTNGFTPFSINEMSVSKFLPR